MAGKEYTAKDKIFSKMTREGLTEEMFREGSVKRISQKSRDEPELDSKERDAENSDPGKRLSDGSGRTDNRRMRRYVHVYCKIEYFSFFSKKCLQKTKMFLRFFYL